MIELKDYGEIDLEEAPVIALGCGHFFTAESLDGTLVPNFSLYDVRIISITLNSLESRLTQCL